MNATSSPNLNGYTPTTRIIANTLLHQLDSCTSAADPISLFTADYNGHNRRVGDVTPSRAMLQNKRNALPRNVSTTAALSPVCKRSNTNSHASPRRPIVIVPAAATAAAIINNILVPPAIRQSDSFPPSVLASFFEPQATQPKSRSSNGAAMLG